MYFHRILHSNSITDLPESVFANLKNLWNLLVIPKCTFNFAWICNHDKNMEIFYLFTAVGKVEEFLLIPAWYIQINS